jgi:RNA polymerase sigma factor (TIGR02999 family)
MPSDADELYRLAYDELRGLTRHYLRSDGAAGSIYPTELANEAFRRIRAKHEGQGTREIESEERKLLVASLARAMRRVLVDAARDRAQLPAEICAVEVALQDDTSITHDRAVDILELDRALSVLAARSESVAQIAEMTIFGGLTQDEIAEHVEVAKQVVVKDWALSRAWLTRELVLQRDRVSGAPRG